VNATVDVIQRAQTFTVIFYGWPIFSCKTARLSDTPRKSVWLAVADVAAFGDGAIIRDNGKDGGFDLRWWIERDPGLIYI
jgi:hypothetical protein